MTLVYDEMNNKFVTLITYHSEKFHIILERLLIEKEIIQVMNQPE